VTLEVNLEVTSCREATAADVAFKRSLACNNDINTLQQYCRLKIIYLSLQYNDNVMTIKWCSMQYGAIEHASKE
jgi:hypothetical protein